MAKKRGLMGILAIMLVFGMLAAGCGNDDSGKSGNTDPKTITITGLNGITGGVEVLVSSQNVGVAGGAGIIKNNSVTIELYEYDNDDYYAKMISWTGNGSYYLELFLEDQEEFYIYTNGKSFKELNITEDTTVAQLFSRLPKYNISSTSSSIPFNKFKKVPEWGGYEGE